MQGSVSGCKMFTEADSNSHDYSDPQVPSSPSSPLKEVAFRSNKDTDLVRELTGFDENEFKDKVRKSYNDFYRKLKGKYSIN